VVAPGWAGRVWVGPGAPSTAGTVFARAIGARDCVLGASTLAAAGSGGDTTRMVRLGAMSDLADAVASLLAARRLDPRRRVAMPLLAGGLGVAGLVAARWAAEADAAAASPGTLSDEVSARVGRRDDVDLRAVDQARV
jgi:hypothetical protein